MKIRKSLFLLPVVLLAAPALSAEPVTVVVGKDAPKLEQFAAEHGLTLLQDMYHQWPFFHALIENVQLDVAKADLGIAELYASLVKDNHIRDTMFSRIRAEHSRTYTMLCRVLEQDELLDNSKVIKRSIERRNPYVDPMSFLQIDLLRSWRAGDREDDSVFRALMASVNGIALGLQNTG